MSQIQFSYKDRDYTLEYTRTTARQMEAAGFVLDDLTEKMMTKSLELFRGAFLAHHKFIKNDLVEEIYYSIKNRSELIKKLADMYREPYFELLDDDAGNVEWTEMS